MITIFGIKNCDTMKKAFAWLAEHKIEYRFHDFKKDGIEAELVETWNKELGWENLLNKRGTTWRSLPDAIKNNIDQTSAIQLMLEKPSVIKRPVVSDGKNIFVGFSAEEFTRRLKS